VKRDLLRKQSQLGTVATKAAYRFFSNPRVDEGNSSAGEQPGPPAGIRAGARALLRVTMLIRC
jgi:hypothetical protein